MTGTVAAGPVIGQRLEGQLDAADAWWQVAGTDPGEALGLCARAGDVDGDGAADLFLGSRWDAVDVMRGPLAAGSWAENEVTTFRLEPTDSSACRFFLWDLEADGRPEIWVSEYNYGYPNDDWHLYCLDSAMTGSVDPMDLVPITTFASGYDGEHMTFGPPVDQDDDGDVDIWATSPWGVPAIGLVPGPLLGTISPLATATAVFFPDPSADGGVVAFRSDSLAMGAFDGDDTPDLAFPVYGHFGYGEGAVVVVSNPPIVVAPLEDVETTRIQGELVVNRAIGLWGVNAVPDMDGDGYDELTFGAGLADSSARGALYLQYGPPPAGIVPETAVSAIFESPPWYGGIFEVVPGDFDGDGTTDLAAGGKTDGGVVQVYLLYGPVETGVHDIAEADAFVAGGTVGDVADMDGDGIDDLVLTSPYDALDDVGSVSIFLGGL